MKDPMKDPDKFWLETFHRLSLETRKLEEEEEPSWEEYEKSIGHIEVILGERASGKSEELIRRAMRAQYQYCSQHILVFKPSNQPKSILSHSKSSWVRAFFVSTVSEIEEKISEVEEALILDLGEEDARIDVICIDDVQCFGVEIIALCERLIKERIRVVVAGLPKDLNGDLLHPIMADASFAHKMPK